MGESFAADILSGLVTADSLAATKDAQKREEFRPPMRPREHGFSNTLY